MTEAEWRGCDSPEAMLNHLTDRASARKLRLYALACCRRIWHLFTDDRCRHAVEVAQRFVDGRATTAELSAAGQVAAGAARVWGDVGNQVSRATHALGGAAWATTRPSAWVAAWDAAWDSRMASRDFVNAHGWEGERAWQAGVLHDLFGNPFKHITLDPMCLTANDGIVTKMAQLIYHEDRFGDLPILADALEEGGCATQDVLDHCRERRPHYRGCWVVDLVLGHS